MGKTTTTTQTAATRNAHILFTTVLAAAVTACGDAQDEYIDTLSSPLDSAADYQPVPGGLLVHRSCTREIPDGATVVKDATGFDIRLDGKSVERVPPCEHPPIRADEADTMRHARGQPPAVNGWIEASRRTATTNSWGYAWFNKIETKWTVPNAPSSSGGLIYFFNSLSQNPTTTEILQPVLQYGCCSPAGGGNYWQIRSWFVTSSGTALYSPKVDVSSGNTITGIVSGASCNTAGDDCNWTVQAKKSPWSTGLYVTSATQVFNRANRAVLEAYAIGSCNQLPNSPSTTFTDTYLYMPGPNPSDLNEMGATSGWSGVVSGGSPDCGYTVSNSGRNATLTY